MNTNVTALELQALTILEAAAASDVGLVLRTNDTMRAKAILYRFRRESGNVEMRKVQIRFSPEDPNRELWLVRRDSDQGDE